MKKKKSSVNILSPDGITIRLENFETKDHAKTFFDKWIKRFEKQGYYSSNKGRIPLNEVWDNCQYVHY